MAKNVETIVTPFGVAQYPWLTTEDPTYGKFKTQLKLTASETKALKKQAEAFVKANFTGKKIKGMPFKEHDEVGEVFFGSSKFKPVLVNGKNQPLALDGQFVGAGTTMRLMGNFAIANDFCVFQLSKVQVRTLVASGGGGEEFPEDEEAEDDVSEGESLDI